MALRIESELKPGIPLKGGPVLVIKVTEMKAGSKTGNKADFILYEEKKGDK